MKYFIARSREASFGNDLGFLCLYDEKPERDVNYWVTSNSECFLPIDRNLFPELKWEDEPIEVELAVKKASTKAVPEEETGLKFGYDDATMTASVTGVENMDITEVIIPSQVVYEGEVYDVTTIGDYAFAYRLSLASIVIPNSVTTIGKYAFYNCTSLTSIEIPNSVASIGENAFEGCKSLTSIAIPESVTTIGSFAFYDCTSLKTAKVPETLKGKVELDFPRTCKIEWY